MATKVKQPQLDDPILNFSIARQGFVNSNLDVWQRGVTFTNPNSGAYTADHIQVGVAPDGGTHPTVIHTKESVVPGSLPNSFYHYRINVNGAGTSLGNGSYYRFVHRVEHGTRYLAGAGKTITISIWVKSDITNKRMGYELRQEYGTGGSPTASEVITGNIVTLSSGWTKFTKTFTLNTLTGKTFGTNNDDRLTFIVYFQWGTTIATSAFGGGTAESFVGSGNIDFTQMSFCAGSEALVYQPKSLHQEYLDCYRYYYRMNPGSAYGVHGVGYCYLTTAANVMVPLPVPMRIIPALGYNAYNKLQIANANVPVTAMYGYGIANDPHYYIDCRAASGLTTGAAAALLAANATDGWIDFTAEF